MKSISIYMTALALLSSTVIIAQTKEDTLIVKKPMIIDGKKVRITIDTKDKDHQTKTSKIIYNGDTTIIDSEEVIKEEQISDEQDGAGENIEKEVKIIKKEKKKTNKHHDDDDKSNNSSEWFSVDFGFNFLSYKGTLDMPEAYKGLELENGKGCNFNLRIYEQSIGIVPKHLYLVYGAGLDWNNYRFKNNVDLLKDSSSLNYTINPNIDYKKNKLVTTYLTIPVMLKFKFNESKKGEAFQLAIGPQFGYLLNSHTKQKWEANGEDHKQKINGDYNIDELRIGYSLYLGFKGVDFYARYYPESAFKANQGPDANTVCLGLSIGGF